MKVPVPTFFQRMVARFWGAVLFIAFFPVFVVLAVKVLAMVFPFLLGAAVLLTVVRLLVQRHQGWW